MTKVVISEALIAELGAFLKNKRKIDLITVYLFFIEKKFELDPVVFVREKTIFQSKEALLKLLEDQGKLWREAEIKIQVGQAKVNEATKKIYICPYSGKVFADNTHPNPQDAIYDWVSRCPENTERKDGVKVKKFFVTEDPNVIKNYIEKRKEPITKTVYTSVVTGKLFHSKKAVIDDFVKHQIKHVSLPEVVKQNRFEIQENFLAFIQDQLEENKVAAFVEALSEHDIFAKHLEHWTEEEEEEE